MKTLTSSDMLTAARRTLAQHQATRPATEMEQQAIVAQYTADADAWDRESARVYEPRTASELGPGKFAVDDQHREGIAVAKSLQQASHARRFAEVCRMRAEAWESAPAIDLWEQTRRALQARVNHYAQLCGE